jgi:hypothetical protein
VEDLRNAHLKNSQNWDKYLNSYTAFHKMWEACKRNCLKYQNIAFLSAHKSGLDFHTNNERTQLLRSQLIQHGLEFTGVRINGVNHFMVVSTNIQLIKKLAKDFKCGKIYLSDSRRTLFEVSCADNFKPTKLGVLKRALSSKSSPTSTGGGFCLIVEDEGNSYYYTAQ